MHISVNVAFLLYTMHQAVYAMPPPILPSIPTPYISSQPTGSTPGLNIKVSGRSSTLYPLIPDAGMLGSTPFSGAPEIKELPPWGSGIFVW